MSETQASLIVLGILFLCMIFFAGCNSLLQQKVNVQEIEGTVVDKYVKRYGDSDRFHIVLETNDGKHHVLQNKDAFWWSKFDSADVQQEIEIGKRYRLTVVGWRWKFRSWFPNVVKYQQIEE